MRRINTLIFVMTLSLCSVFSGHVMAQQGKILAGAGLSYASDISSIGLTLKGVYLVNDTWEAGAGFTYFFEKDYTQWSMLDLDGHYVFKSDDQLSLYALGGLNFTFWKIDLGPEYNSFWGGMAETNGTEVGINLGGGARYAIANNLSVLGEVKYTLGGFNFFTLGAGVVYHF